MQFSLHKHHILHTPGNTVSGLRNAPGIYWKNFRCWKKIILILGIMNHLASLQHVVVVSTHKLDFLNIQLQVCSHPQPFFPITSLFNQNMEYSAAHRWFNIPSPTCLSSQPEPAESTMSLHLARSIDNTTRRNSLKLCTKCFHYDFKNIVYC